MVPDTTIEPGPGALSGYYQWFDNADTGSVLCYYLGDLQYDRDTDANGRLSAERRREIDALNSLANRLLADAREGLVKLFQRKIEENVYEYLAVMVRRPNAAPSERKDVARGRSLQPV